MISKVFILILTYVSITTNSFAICTGRFINPITDVCWTCLFPITIGAIPIVPGIVPDTINPPSPICVCPGKLAGLPLPGIALGLWEPVRLMDISKQPFCFVSLGGVQIPAQVFTGMTSNSVKGEDGATNWHAHYYIMPLLYLLSIALNELCLEIDGADLSYLTEIDPLWMDDELTFIINPESVIFGNLIAQTACVADCVAATVHLPFDPLFWCNGCQGSLYPMTGNIEGDYGSIQTSLLTVGRMLYKLGRQGMAWDTSGPEAQCQPIPMPIIKKSQYRTQLTYPIPMILPGGCKPLGRSNVFYDSYKELPTVGEDFGYLIWRKRNCCVL